VIIAVEKVDGVTQALVEVDPAALNDWEVMADLGGPITLRRPLRLWSRQEDMRLITVVQPVRASAEIGFRAARTGGA
jgi:hypothetical protein